MSDNDKEFIFEETSPLNEVEFDDIDAALNAAADAVAAEAAAEEAAVAKAAAEETAVAEAAEEAVTIAAQGAAAEVSEGKPKSDDAGAVDVKAVEDTPAEASADISAEKKDNGTQDDSFEDFFSDDELMSEDDLFVGSSGKASSEASKAQADTSEDILDLEAPHETVDDIEKEERRKLVSTVISILIPSVLAVIILISGYMFLRDLLEYKSAENEYKKLNEFIVEIDGNADRYAVLDPEFSGSVVKVTSSKSSYASSSVWYPMLDIDFESLKEINPDFTCVLYVPNLDMTYPVVQSEDNTDYLSKTFEGSKNSSGCIFLDMNASASFSDSNSIIYGHNMRNGTMFGSLNKYLLDPELCDDLPYFFLYQEGVVLKYRIFAYYTTPVDSDVYYGFQDASGYNTYVERALSSSVYETEDTFDFSSYPPMVLLSTCYGSGHVYNMVVHGVLEAKIKVDY